MKKISLIILAALLLFSGCASPGKSFERPVKFYYCTNPEHYDSADNVIASVIREAKDYASDIELLNDYLKGEDTEGFVSYFPEGTCVEALSIDGATVRLSLSEEFATLSGLELSLAGICLSMTVFAFMDADTAELSVDGYSLDGNEILSIRKSDLLFADTQILTS